MQYHEIGKTGMKVSSLSFGASSLGGVFHNIKEKEGITSVSNQESTLLTYRPTTGTTKPKPFWGKH